jgi:protein-disulfide isomerase
MGKSRGRGHPSGLVREQRARERRLRRTLWTSLVAVAVLAIFGLVGWGVFAAQRGHDYNAPPDTTDDDTGILVGSGPVVVDVYEDFICPACRQFEQAAGPTLDRLVAEEKVRIAYHPVAFLDRFSSTEYSTRAAAAAACAAVGSKFREYSQKLFQQQPPEGGPGLSDQQLVNLGTSVGLSVDSFAPCVFDGTYRQWTRHVTEEASRAGVTGTPTVLVADKPVRASADAITAAVAAAGR